MIRFKHPRIYHLPWSESISDDDEVLVFFDQFKNQEVVVTEKMDGENTSFYSDGYVHARSIDNDSHYTRDWVKNLASQMYFNIPEGWRICGENLAYIHSIKYTNLQTYFFVHSIWNENNICLSWKDTEEYADLLGLKTVPVLYKGIFDTTKIKSLYQSRMEGYVIRVSREIIFNEYNQCIAKFVRKNHVQTSEHWKHNTQLAMNELTN